MNNRRCKICLSRREIRLTFYGISSINMAFRTGPMGLWPLFIFFFCSNFVTSSLITDWPKTYWLDQSCIEKTRPFNDNDLPTPFTVEAVQESLHMAFRGSRRLSNSRDIYVGWLFSFLFKIQRPTLNISSGSTPWLVIRKNCPCCPGLDAVKRSESPPRSLRLDFRNDEHRRPGDCRRPDLLW